MTIRSDLTECGVTDVLDYKGNDGDITFILEDERDIQELRVYYLRSKRDEWKWVRDSKIGTPYVTIKYK